MRKMLFGFLAICAFSAPVSASPIVYAGTLIDGVPQNGVNTQAPGSQTTTGGATYYNFFATAGDLVNLFGDRLAGHYDMSLGVWSGLYADTNDLAFFDANFIAFGDDQDPPNIPGPFGDPNVSFIAPLTGWYTVAVTNFLSNAGPPNPFSLQVNGNTPEPATMAVFGLLAAGAFGMRRRLKGR